MDIFRRKYGSTDPIYFYLWAPDGTGLVTGVTSDLGSDDIQWSKDGAAHEDIGGTFAEVARGLYKYTPTAAEMQCKVGALNIHDVEAVCLDKGIIVETSHHPSAQHPEGVIAAGLVTTYTSPVSIVLPTGLNIQKGSLIEAVSGTGQGGGAFVFSYNSVNGATVLEDPGFPAALASGTTSFEAYAGGNATALLIDEDGLAHSVVKKVVETEIQGTGVLGDKFRPV